LARCSVQAVDMFGSAIESARAGRCAGPQGHRVLLLLLLAALAPMGPTRAQRGPCFAAVARATNGRAHTEAGPQCMRAVGQTMEAPPRTQTTEDFAAAIRAGGPVVLDISATWCGPCKLVAKELAKVEERFAGKVTVLTLDLMENEELASALKVTMLPTVLLFKDASPVPLHRFDGIVSSDILGATIDQKLLG